MRNYRKVALIVCITIAIFYIVYEILNSESKYRMLAKEGNLTIAVIVKVKEKAKRNEVLYYYSFEVDSRLITGKVQYDYHWEDIKLNLGDSIYILYLPSNPNVNCDYRYLKENEYGIDSIRYDRVLFR